MQVHGQRHILAACDGVGGVVYEFAVELEVSGIAQYRGDACTLVVEHVTVERHTGVYICCRSIGHHYMPHRRIVDIVVDRGYAVGFALVDDVAYFHTLLFGSGCDSVDFHARVEVASVHQSLHKLSSRCLGEFRIVDYRRLSHTTQPSVVPSGGIAARETVGA